MGQDVTSVQNFSKKSNGADEFDLAGLIVSLLQQKKIIGLCVLLFGFLGALYAYFSPKEYQVSSVLRPVSINELDALNRSELYKLNPEDALLKLGGALGSYSIRRTYFEANQGLFKSLIDPALTVDQNFDLIDKNFVQVIVPDSNKTSQFTPTIVLEMKYPLGVDGAKILNGFLAFVLQQQKVQVTTGFESIRKNRLAELNAKIDAVRSNYEAAKVSRIATLEEADRLNRAQLQDELAALRLQLKTKRKDRIAELNEAINIARSLGIKRPTTPSAMSEDGRVSGGGGMVRTEVNNQRVPPYFMGSDALEAERLSLLQRQNDDFTDSRVAEIAKELKMLEVNRQIQQLHQRENEDNFLTGLEPLRAEIVRLHNLNVDLQHLRIASVDREAMEPSGPIKPNKVFVIGVALLLGLIVGVITALVRGFFVLRPVLLTSAPIVLASAEGGVDHLYAKNRSLK